jgi:hypothetical protein
MGASTWRNWLWWAILAPGLAGCQGLFNNQGPPRDPLFFSKTPISAKPELTPPIAFAYLEPSLPRDPFLVKNPAVFADKSGGTVPGTLTNRTSGED